MIRLSVDDQSSDLQVDASQKVGDVLNCVLSSLPPNRIVTDVVLDGKQLSKSQEAGFLGQMLAQVKELQIRTADREIWAATGIDIALSCLERVQRSLIRAAELFRDENQGKANGFFVHCIDGLERFFEAVVISRSVLKLDFTQVGIDGMMLSRIEQEFSGILKSIIQYQEQQDYIGVADKIEYELLTNLFSWNKALTKIQLGQNSNA